MLYILKALEPICIPAKEIIYYELDEVNEIIFVEEGKYDVGYEINKVKKFKLRLTKNSVIGAFNVLFDRRQNFIYRAYTDCKGYFIRKIGWKKILNMYPEFKPILRKKVLFEFFFQVRKPIDRFKLQEIEKYNTRNDF